MTISFLEKHRATGAGTRFADDGYQDFDVNLRRTGTAHRNSSAVMLR